MTAGEKRLVEILYVEDNPGDAMFVAAGLERLRTPTRLHVAKDALLALQILGGDSTTPPAVPIDLILLDIKLPGMSGLELLKIIREDKRLRELPVIMLTSSSAPSDMRQARQLSVEDYRLKPASLNELFALIEELDDQWLKPIAQGLAGRFRGEPRPTSRL